MDKKIMNILSEIGKCQLCKTIKGYEKFPAGSHGTAESGYMLISEAPGKDSISQGKYWVGAGGKLLRSALKESGKDLESLFYLTDIVKCWPNEYGRNRAPLESEILNCRKFINQEIECLQPAFILSLGKTCSEILLNQEINLETSHGRLFKFNNTIKLLVMYHPSYINKYQTDKRDVYVRQLKDVFDKLIRKDLESIEDIFTFPQRAAIQDHKKNSSETLSLPDTSLKGFSFTLPSPGNSITATDISKNQLRITVDFKSYFPHSDTTLLFHHKGGKYPVKFINKDRKHLQDHDRSHILKLGPHLGQMLNLHTNCSVRITKTKPTEFLIERL